MALTIKSMVITLAGGILAGILIGVSVSGMIYDARIARTALKHIEEQLERDEAAMKVADHYRLLEQKWRQDKQRMEHEAQKSQADRNTAYRELSYSHLRLRDAFKARLRDDAAAVRPDIKSGDGSDSAPAVPAVVFGGCIEALHSVAEFADDANAARVNCIRSYRSIENGVLP